MVLVDSADLNVDVFQQPVPVACFGHCRNKGCDYIIMDIIFYIVLGMVITNFFMLCFITLMVWGIGEYIAEVTQERKK